ncbi:MULTISPECIES: TadE/TadG family type IV pilus assembly protein [unclassified Sinorhizobium]|uniref:TadE/TadG family type IV pilus assembly protein n=1 Tax=unclassified Sinorhizobium TaxID=2613772 RepID=UPI003525CA93
MRTISKRFLSDRQGIGAIEFALLVPVLLMLYFGAVGATVGFSMAKRATRASGTVADIVTQQTSVDKTYLAEMPSVARSIFAPYRTDKLTLNITGITIDNSANAKVAWSWGWKDNENTKDDPKDGTVTTPYPVNSAVTVPDEMKKANTFLVRSELLIPYDLFAFAPGFLPDGNITIKRDFFYRQRTGDSVTCGNC